MKIIAAAIVWLLLLSNNAAFSQSTTVSGDEIKRLFRDNNAASSEELSGISKQDPRHYDFRGIRLGMRLSEFKGMAHPDKKPAKVFCSNDSQTKLPTLGDTSKLILGSDEATRILNTHNRLVGERLHLSRLSATTEDQKIAGVISCGYFEFRKESKYSSGKIWLPSSVNIATVDVDLVRFYFISDPEQSDQIVLYSIVARSTPSDWSKFWEGYSNKYGMPFFVSDEPTQNRVGAKFDNTIAVWQNDQSRILLVKRLGNIDTTAITYEHSRLAKEVDLRVRTKKGRPVDKL